jgi:hypothetical protein
VRVEFELHGERNHSMLYVQRNWFTLSTKSLPSIKATRPASEEASLL